MDESTPAIEETMNATFLSKISIEAGYIPEENLENEILLQVTSLTESLNNISEIFEITGTSTNYNLIEYSLDNSHWSRIENPSTNITITQEFTEEGKHAFYIRDEVGNIKEIEVQTTKLDKTVPEIKIEETDNQENVELHITFTENQNLSGYAITESKEEPTEWTSIEGKEITIEYTLTENTTYYIWVKDSVGNMSYQKYSTDNTIWNELSKEEWYGFTSEEEREDTLYIRAIDNAGNVSNIESTVLKIDRTAPSAPVITNSKNNVWSKEAVTVSMKSSDSRSGIARYEWYENGSWTTREINISDGTGSITYTAQRNETIRIRAVDSAGNVSSESTTIVKIDTTNPTAKISATVSNNTIKVSASGSSDTNSGIKNYQYSKDNKTWYTSTSNSYTFTGLADGTYTVYVKVTDNSGRTSVASTSKNVAYANVYVASYGNDSSGDGSSVNPYATVKKAYNQVVNGGNINLLSNISVSQSIVLNSTKNVKIQGYNSVYSLERTSSITGEVLLLVANSEVTLSNVILDGKNIASTASLIQLLNQATLNVNAGVTIQNTNMTSSWTGGAFYMNNSTLNINGGSISNNVSNNIGAAMQLYNHSVLVLNSGNITNNRTLDASSGGGGAIYLDGGNITINNGNISNNNCPYIGGAILVASRPYAQTITIKGGTMSNNSATNGGFAAMYTPGGSTNIHPVISLVAGNIVDNKASSQGGAFYLNGGIVNVNGGEITRNSASASGGAIFVTNLSTFNMSNGYISNNTAGSSTQSTGMGGGINVWCGTLTMTGGNIINNQAYQSAGGAGGGIYADCYTSGQTSVNITAGEISGNSRYGVVYHSSMVNYSQTGGHISNNSPDNLYPW